MTSLFRCKKQRLATFYLFEELDNEISELRDARGQRRLSMEAALIAMHVYCPCLPKFKRADLNSPPNVRKNALELTGTSPGVLKNLVHYFELERATSNMTDNFVHISSTLVNFKRKISSIKHSDAKYCIICDFVCFESWKKQL